MRRRQVVLGTGVALATTIAGCVGEESPDDGGTASETNGSGTDATDNSDGSEAETEDDGDDEDEAGDDEAATEGDEDGANDDEAETEGDEDGASETEDDDIDDDEAETEDEPFDVDSEPPIQGLRVTEDALVEDGYSTSVVGTIVNESGEDLAAIEVAAAFYGADGDRVDENSTNVGGMDDEDELPIEIKSFEDDIVEYEVAVVNAKPHEQIFG